MDFATFAQYAHTIEKHDSDTDIIRTTADLFRDAASETNDTLLEIIPRFIQGRIFPAWKMDKLNIGPSNLNEALAKAATDDLTGDDITDKLRTIGEIGAVANTLSYGAQTGLSSFGETDTTSELTVTDVYTTLTQISTLDGSGSTSSKVNALFGLFNDCTPLEARYLARLVVSKMRIGVGEGTVRDAITTAFFDTTTVDAQVAVERALQVSNDYGAVAVAAARDGMDGVSEISLQVGRPIQSMLAQASTISDAVDAFDSVIVEEKYDGARAQIHYDGDTARVFSRQMEEVTDSVPEIVEYVEQNVADPVILDGEVVAVDGEYEDVLRRFRRQDRVYEMRQEIPLRYRPFDLLYVNSTVLFDTPLQTRQRQLRDTYPAEHISTTEQLSSVNAIREFEQDALANGKEGIMLKNAASTYQAGRRGQDWLKVKPDVDTLDLAIIGGEWGESRREGWIGSILLGVRTGVDDFQPIGKVGTGLTDDELAELTDRLEPHIQKEDGQTVTFDPRVVIEVGYEKIQSSPTYESGYALRFPRFLGYRDDKTLSEVDSLDRVTNLKQQADT